MWNEGIITYGIFGGVYSYGTSEVFYNYPKLSCSFLTNKKKKKLRFFFFFFKDRKERIKLA